MASASRPPETDIARVRRYCQRRVPPHARDQVRLETVVRGSAITIMERRASWRDDFGPEWSRLKVAQLRYDHGSLTLHWAGRNGRWLPYSDLDPSPRLNDLLVFRRHRLDHWSLLHRVRPVVAGDHQRDV
jgi:Protein of unknown function (DUF3024)